MGVPGWPGPRVGRGRRQNRRQKPDEPTPAVERVQMYCAGGQTEWSPWSTPSPFLRSPSWRRPLNGGRWKPRGRKCCAMRPSSVTCYSGTCGESQRGGPGVWNVPRGGAGRSKSGPSVLIGGGGVRSPAPCADPARRRGATSGV